MYLFFLGGWRWEEDFLLMLCFSKSMQLNMYQSLFREVKVLLLKDCRKSFIEVFLSSQILLPPICLAIYSLRPSSWLSLLFSSSTRSELCNTGPCLCLDKWPCRSQAQANSLLVESWVVNWGHVPMPSLQWASLCRDGNFFCPGLVLWQVSRRLGDWEDRAHFISTIFQTVRSLQFHKSQQC